MARAATTTDVFTAIAEPRRRRIVEVLARRGALAVGTLVATLGLPQPAVSKHLGVLRKVGMVAAIKQGKHVQVIKPPTLLEICGPLMMSYAAVNHLQYRLKAEGGVTRVAFLHRAMGSIQPDHRDGLSKGWQYWLERIRELAERKNQKETHR